jgi:hypothetical protein
MMGRRLASGSRWRFRIRAGGEGSLEGLLLGTVLLVFGSTGCVTTTEETSSPALFKPGPPSSPGMPTKPSGTLAPKPVGQPIY